jgi:hypothetical protein
MLLAYGSSCSVEAVRAMTGVEVAPLVFHITRGGLARPVRMTSPCWSPGSGWSRRSQRSHTARRDRDPAHPVIAHARARQRHGETTRAVHKRGPEPALPLRAAVLA